MNNGIIVQAVVERGTLQIEGGGCCFCWRPMADREASEGKKAGWAAHGEGRHQWLSGGRFLAAACASEGQELLRICVRNLQAPVQRLLLSRATGHGAPETRTAHQNWADSLRAPGASGDLTPDELLRCLAWRGFAPKLSLDCVPELSQFCHQMDGCLAACTAQCGLDKPRRPATAPSFAERDFFEVCEGIHNQLVLAIHRSGIQRAGRYHAMDKARALWCWGYHAGFVEDMVLSEASFQRLRAMQRSGRGAVGDPCEFFDVVTAERFGKLCLDLGAIIRRPATAAGAALWPLVFVHLCEAKQAVNSLGIPAITDLLRTDPESYAIDLEEARRG